MFICKILYFFTINNIIEKLFASTLFDLCIPLSHRDPLHPTAHPSSHCPVTWLQTVLSLQCPEHCCLQSVPYKPPIHSNR